MKKWTEEEVEQFIGLVLRIGVSISALVILCGGILYLRERHSDLVAYQVFSGQPPNLIHIVEIFRGAFHLRPASLIQSGLLLLIATPIARVALAAVAFSLERDRMYLIFASIVLAILIGSLMQSQGF